VTKVDARRRNLVRTTVGLLSAAYAATFVVAVLLHLGVQMPLGLAELDEPLRPVAVFVEGTIALALALGAFAVLSRRTWAWAATTGGYALGTAGVAWGMVAIAAGRGPHTELNDTFHRVMVVLLAAGLIFLLTAWGRQSLRPARGKDDY
jgi:hypothetical protein